LARRHFAAKTPIFDYWISLDFLGFSRQNRYFSMGYGGLTREEFSQASVMFVVDAHDVSNVKTEESFMGQA
jgi:hypothetical protein